MKKTFLIKRDNPDRVSVVVRCQEFIRTAYADNDLLVTITEPKRTLAENALLHALLSEIAAQVEWAGKKRDVEVWKRLVVSAWCRARGEPVEILPALDGHGIDIVPVRTSKLNKRDCAELIEFVYHIGAKHGVTFTEAG